MRWIFDYFRFTWYDLCDACQVKRLYYRDQDFRSIDRDLLRRYIFRSPYRMSRQYLRKRKARDVHTYGETPLITFEKMAKEGKVIPLDRILELGSGRGRGALFLAHFYNCQVVGIERIPQFVKLANHVASHHKMENVSFQCADMFKVDWSKADVIFLYGTCLEESEILLAIAKFKQCPIGTRIISVSYSLIEYDLSETFKVIKSFPVSFPWGKTEAFLQVVQ
jgi:SAM-dependent methyltransferase